MLAMPERNVEVVRRAAEAFSRGDWDQMLADFAGPDFEYVTSGMIPGTGGVYRGVDEFRRVSWRGSLASSTISIRTSTRSSRPEIRCSSR